MAFRSVDLRFCRFLGVSTLLWQAAFAWQYNTAIQQPWFQPTIADEHVHLQPIEQRYIQPASGLLTVLMPIDPTQQTLALLRTQLSTFIFFLNLSTITEILIVTPAEHKAELSAFFQKEMLRQLPGQRQDLFRIVDDGECIPEANPEFEWYRAPADYWWNGWLTQQLLKLACAPLVKTPFYLLLDADVFAARPFAASDLFELRQCEPGSAVCDEEGQLQLRAKNDCHQSYDGSNRQNVEW